MRTKHLSLPAKLNIGILAVFLVLSCLLLVFSNNLYRRTVYDPYVRKLEDPAQMYLQEIPSCLESLLQYVGTEELDSRRAPDEDDTYYTFQIWFASAPSRSGDDDPGRRLSDDLFTTLFALDNVEKDMGLDEIALELRKDGTAYSVFRKYSWEETGDIIFSSFGSLELFYSEQDPDNFLARPVQFKLGDSYKLCRTLRVDTDSGSSYIWLIYDMTAILREYWRFLNTSIIIVAILALLASAVNIWVLRRLVTRRVRSLAKATREFTPGDDGKYTLAGIIGKEITSGDELGDLGRDIQSMQERIVENTDRVARMAAEQERISTEMQLAAGIQAGALPSVFPAFPDRREFSLYASMTPAREVGGDFYDFFLVDDDHLALVIADVSGKGIPAALFMMVSKALIKTQLMNGCDPALAMDRVNKQLCESNQQNMFVTVWLAVVELSTGRGLACNAGHENPAVCRAGGRFMILRDKHDMSAGAISMAKYRLREFELNPGDCLFVYTDGVPESTDVNGIMFRDDRLTRVLNRDPAASPEELVTRVHEELDAFADGAPQFDDITMLCLRYNGAGRLIILNGPSSAGKSSIAAELRQQLAAAGRDPVLLSIDDYMKIGTDEEIWEDDVFEIMPDMCRDLTAALREGRWVVVDHVATSERIWQALLDAAEGCPVTSVQVTCSLETLKKREQERGNRFPGSAEASFRYLYPQEGYDLRINSEESNPKTSAGIIFRHLFGDSQ